MGTTVFGSSSGWRARCRSITEPGWGRCASFWLLSCLCTGLGGRKLAHLRQGGFQRIGVLCLGKGKVQFGQNLRVAAQIERLVGHQTRSIPQDAANFLLFL